MIILMHPKYLPQIEDGDMMRKWAAENHISNTTRIVLQDDLPEFDDEGKPIFAFTVSAKELHYWRGEPILLKEREQ